MESKKLLYTTDPPFCQMDAYCRLFSKKQEYTVHDETVVMDDITAIRKITSTKTTEDAIEILVGNRVKITIPNIVTKYVPVNTESASYIHGNGTLEYYNTDTDGPFPTHVNFYSDPRDSLSPARVVITIIDEYNILNKNTKQFCYSANLARIIN